MTNSKSIVFLAVALSTRHFMAAFQSVVSSLTVSSCDVCKVTFVRAISSVCQLISPQKNDCGTFFKWLRCTCYLRKTIVGLSANAWEALVFSEERLRDCDVSTKSGRENSRLVDLEPEFERMQMRAQK